ncbi:Gamma-glutamyl phosphate reductase [Sporomusa rhizae]|uniref:glutamate-5-semialdehyde dehydrogenase n=1 Tax=Sporomusa rhizae TaxID=357999 RepID=UPI003529ED83
MNELAHRVKDASLRLAGVGTDRKNEALAQIAEALKNSKEKIIKANREDLLRSKQENLPEPLLKRLNFDEAKIEVVIDGIFSLIHLDDPVGKTLLSTKLDDGLELYKVTCPLGVIGIIFESRPDAMVQIATLCLKSGNGALLKGGVEARETNRVLAEIIIKATEKAGIPSNWFALLETRSEVSEMLKMNQYIDLIIPRGSNEFVRYIKENSKIPVMGHSDGICHCYVAEDADVNMAIKIVSDAKTEHVAACNALETLLVHKKIAPEFLPVLKESLDNKNVELIGCSETCGLISVTAAPEEDWKTEYLDYKLSVKIVTGFDEAIEHINTYGSGHTDIIITPDKEKAMQFMEYVDSGNTFWNCSTRFSDGFRYGFGAEVGISTNKLHARGPVGLEGLVIYKYKLLGSGQIVGDYTTRSRTFKHEKMKKEFPLV